MVWFLLRNKNGQIKLRLGNYLAKLRDAEKKELAPYLRGIFIIGISIPVFVWAIDAGSSLILNKLQQTKAEQIHAYESMGRCYANKDCRHIVLNNPVQTDQDMVGLTGQIRQYMISNKRSGLNS